MGDRTVVELKILESQYEQAKACFDGDGPDEETHFSFFDGTRCSCLVFHDVNYGELPFLDQLQRMGIAFDARWGHGDEYGPGGTYLRFSPDGDFTRKEYSEEGINPDLYQLMELVDNPPALCEFIVNHHAYIHVEPLAQNQEAYGKLYRTKALINAA